MKPRVSDGEPEHPPVPRSRDSSPRLSSSVSRGENAHILAAPLLTLEVPEKVREKPEMIYQPQITDYRLQIILRLNIHFDTFTFNAVGTVNKQYLRL